MKVLIDECLPRGLRRWLNNVDASTVQECGWAGTKNGMLLRLAEPQFDVFLTSDQSLKYQQNLQGRTIAIVVLPTNDAVALRALIPQIQTVVAAVKSGDYVEL